MFEDIAAENLRRNKNHTIAEIFAKFNPTKNFFAKMGSIGFQELDRLAKAQPGEYLEDALDDAPSHDHWEKGIAEVSYSSGIESQFLRDLTTQTGYPISSINQILQLDENDLSLQLKALPMLHEYISELRPLLSTKLRTIQNVSKQLGVELSFDLNNVAQFWLEADSVDDLRTLIVLAKSLQQQCEDLDGMFVDMCWITALKDEIDTEYYIGLLAQKVDDFPGNPGNLKWESVLEKEFKEMSVRIEMAARTEAAKLQINGIDDDENMGAA